MIIIPLVDKFIIRMSWDRKNGSNLYTFRDFSILLFLPLKELSACITKSREKNSLEANIVLVLETLDLLYWDPSGLSKEEAFLPFQLSNRRRNWAVIITLVETEEVFK